jgi:hypothetical protein
MSYRGSKLTLRGSRPRGVFVIFALILALARLAPQTHAKVETWREEGVSAFSKCHREDVIISDTGRVRLGHALKRLGGFSAERVWDLKRLSNGSIVAATGDAGKVFECKAGAADTWSVLFDAADSQVLALAVAPNGTLFAGTGPGGQVIDLTTPGHPVSRPDPKVQYIWDLTCDQHNNLYAATGPGGQLWKRSTDGKWSLLYDSKATHLLSLAVASDGSIYAGSDGERLVYHLDGTHKPTILFDAPQSEIRTLLAAPDGVLYVGTAADASGSGSSRGSLFSSRSEMFERPSPGRESGEGTVPSSAFGGIAAQSAPAAGGGSARISSGRPSGGSAAPRPAAPGENAVYRIDHDGVPREVLRVKALIHTLALAGDRLLVGTGPDGQIYEVRDRGDETSPIAKLDHGQILALAVDGDGSVLIGTGDPGSVVRLSSTFAPSGRLISDVHDTKLVSRFGSLSWIGDQPAGTSIGFQTRTGNVGEPDDTWSDWSAEQTDAVSAKANSPSGRFIQYRARLATTVPGKSPELRSVSLSFRTANLAPEIARLEIPDLSAGDGAARQTKLNLRWTASDPNDDELRFTLQVKKEGWPTWIGLNPEPISERTLAWDTTAFPSGLYRLKLIASDRPSNSPEDSLSRDRESSPFIVDHDAPRVTVVPNESKCKVTLQDEFTHIVKADYAIDGGPWISIFPDDGLFDGPRELITVALPELKAGVHLIMVRATDSAGNMGSGDGLIDIKAVVKP